MGQRAKGSWAVAWGLSGAALLLAGSGSAGAGETGPDPAVVGGPPEARLEWGRRLFFDPAISRSGNNSCASCHDPEHGFSDPRRHDDDDFLATRRHAQTLLDLGGLHTLHWDGAFVSIEELIMFRLAPSWLNDYIPLPVRQDFPNTLEYKDEDGVHRTVDQTRLESVMDRVEKDGRYASLAQASFESASITSSRLSEALATFVRSIRHTESPYDRFEAGAADALSPEAKHGLALFRGKAGCVECHRMGPGPAKFTDHDFHDTGAEWRSSHPDGAPSALAEVSARREPPHTTVDPRGGLGRMRITTAPQDVRAFKVPTLRDVARRGPYMHDGSLATLEAVVRRYAGGGAPEDPNLDPRIHKFEASDGEVAALVAFLRSLSGDVRPAVAPDCRLRAKATRVRFHDAEGRPLAGLRLSLVPAGDSLPGDSPLTSTAIAAATDANGRVEYAPPRRTHMRLVLPEGLRAPQGEMIPDTCESLTLTLPVRGRAFLSVRLPATAAVAKRLTAEFPVSRERLADPSVADLPWTRAATRAVFTLEGISSVDGVQLARYATWVHVGAPPSALVEVPCPRGKVSCEVRLEDAAETRVDASAP